MQDFIQYVSSEALILIPVLYILGSIIKATPAVPDWTIPFILLACGITGAIFVLGDPITGAIQGVLVTGAAVLTNQLFKQAKDNK